MRLNRRAVRAGRHHDTMRITDTFAINRSTFPYLPCNDGTDFTCFVRDARREAGPVPHSLLWRRLLLPPRLRIRGLRVGGGDEKLHAPFAALAPGMQAVAAGQVASMMRPVGRAESLARDNRARIIALAQPNRIDRTLGVPLSTGLWLALHAPARTMPTIIARLKEALRTGMRHGTTQAVFRQPAGVAEASTRE